MPDKKQRFQNLKNSLVVFGLITLLIGCFLLAVITPFALEFSNKAAYADSTNGVVENNIFTNPTLANTGSSSSYNGTISNFINDWNLAYGTVSWTNSVFTHTNSTSTWQGIWHQLDFHAGDTFTFTVYGYSSSTLRIYAYNYVSGGRVVLSNASHSNSSSTLLSITFTCPLDATDIRLFIYGAESSSVYYIEWAKLEKSSSFTGYVPNSYENYGYNQGLSDGYENGFNQASQDYLTYAGLVSNLDVSSYISTGGFELNISNSSYDILRAQSVENHTRSGNEGIATIYDGLTAGLNYNIIYTQGSFPSISSSTFNGTAGYYGVKSSLLYANGFNNYIPKGSVFNVNLVSGRANSGRTGSALVRNQSFNIIFLDVNGDPLTYNYDLFADGSYYFIGSDRIFADQSFDGMIMGISNLENGSNSYIRIPYDVYGVLVFSYHNADDYYHAYHINLVYYPATSYSEGYDAGFLAGQSDINTQQYYNYGYSQGFSAGEISGAANANNYTFLGVIGAVIDAPIAGLKGLLNFNLLGYNMQGFVLALLTLSVIILIIRLILGGK